MKLRYLFTAISITVLLAATGWLWFAIRAINGIYFTSQNSFLYRNLLSEEIKEIPIINPTSTPKYWFSIRDGSGVTFNDLSYESRTSKENLINNIDSHLTRIGCAITFPGLEQAIYRCKGNRLEFATYHLSNEDTYPVIYIHLTIKIREEIDDQRHMSLILK
jgi:hypothetical protein